MRTNQSQCRVDDPAYVTKINPETESRIIAARPPPAGGVRSMKPPECPFSHIWLNPGKNDCTVTATEAANAKSQRVPTAVVAEFAAGFGRNKKEERNEALPG